MSAAVGGLTQSRFAALARAAGFWWERQLPSARIVKHFRQVIDNQIEPTREVVAH
jgi:hypothetical protein